MKIEVKPKNYSENDKNQSFVERCTVIVKTTDDNGNATEKKEKGCILQGEEMVFINAPEIYFPENAPLDTEKRELYDILNELFQGGGEGGDVFLVTGTESGITVTMVKNRGEAQELTVEIFTFKTKTYKTITTVNSGKTTIKKTWSKTIITAVQKNDDTVWKFTLDIGGKATAVMDRVGNDVLNGLTGEDGKSVLTTTSEGVALGWALAYNNEQNSVLQKAIDAYKDGIDDCDKINEAEGVGGTGGGDGTGGDGTGNGGDGTGNDGDGTGSGGVNKLPDKKFEAIELPNPGDNDDTANYPACVIYQPSDGVYQYVYAQSYSTRDEGNGRTSVRYTAPVRRITVKNGVVTADYKSNYDFTVVGTSRLFTFI